MFNFEKLDAWQLAIDFADLIYRITKEFPSDERFGLTSQLRRAAVSISSNLAEGNGRGSSKDFAHFIQIAFGSLMECVSQLTIANRQRFLPDAEFRQAYETAERLGRVLSGLRRSIHPPES